MQYFLAIGLLSSFLGWFSPAFAAMPSVNPVHIELKQDAFVDGAYVTVADIGSVDTADSDVQHVIEGIRIARLPRVGYVEQISRQELDRFIRSHVAMPGLKIEWRGAKTARFACATQTVDGEVLASSAKRYLEAELRKRFKEFTVGAASQIADLPVPTGKLEIRPRKVDLSHPLSRMPVWMDIYVNGRIYRSAVVPMAIGIIETVYLARHDLIEGAAISDSDFEMKKEAVPDISVEPAGMPELRLSTRMKKQILRGQILTKSHLAGPAEVFRGDTVKLIAGEGGFMVETRAIAQSDSELGQEIMVRPERGTGAVMARVVSAGVVRMDNR